MKNTGLTLIIVVAVLAVLAGSFYMFKKDNIKDSVDTTTQTENEVNGKPSNEFAEENETTPAPTGAKPGTSTEVNIDSELKGLDTEMGSAWEKDSDSDPTLEIQ